MMDYDDEPVVTSKRSLSASARSCGKKKRVKFDSGSGDDDDDDEDGFVQDVGTSSKARAQATKRLNERIRKLQNQYTGENWALEQYLDKVDHDEQEKGTMTAADLQDLTEKLYRYQRFLGQIYVISTALGTQELLPKDCEEKLDKAESSVKSDLLDLDHRINGRVVIKQGPTKMVPSDESGSNDDADPVPGTGGKKLPPQHMVDKAEPKDAEEDGGGGDENDISDVRKLLDGEDANHEAMVKYSETELVQPSVRMKSTLMLHQQIGFTWLYNKETKPQQAIVDSKKGVESRVKGKAEERRGCILADDMGLGKTVQTIALILSHSYANRQTTLIVAPKALVLQWYNELNKHVKWAHKLNVYIHHRELTNKSALIWDPEKIKEYDVVITTYDVLSRPYMKCKKAKGDKESTYVITDDKEREKMRVLEKVEWLRIVLDEAHTVRNSKTVTFYAVCQLHAMYRLCLSGTPMQNSIKDFQSLMKFLRVQPYDEETYFMGHIGHGLINAKVGRETGENMYMARFQALINQTMLRRTKHTTINHQPILVLPARNVGLDECSFTKEQSQDYRTLETQARSRMTEYENVDNKNRPMFSYVLVLLTRLRQMCDHPALLRMSDPPNSLTSEGCDDKAFDIISSFTGDVKNRVKGYMAEDAELVCPICLEEITLNSIKLLAPCGHYLCDTCIEEFFWLEQNTHNRDPLCPHCREPLSSEKGCDMRLFDLVVVQKFSKGDVKRARDKEKKQQEKERARSQMVQKKMLSRAEAEINDDMFAEMEEAEKESAPEPIDEDTDDEKTDDEAGPEEKESQLYTEVLKEWELDAFFTNQKTGEVVWESSPKIDKCLEIVQRIFTSSKTDKIIIFSQFTSFLDLIAVPLVRHGIEHLRYDGRMDGNARVQAIEKFMEVANTNRVILISIKAGNVGLTLTRANHVVILDPSWNPYVEEQAIDRVHRIGQQKSVHVHRLMIPNTVEDRILELQQGKRQMIDGALDPTGLTAVNKMGAKQLRQLFGMDPINS